MKFQLYNLQVAITRLEESIAHGYPKSVLIRHIQDVQRELRKLIKLIDTSSEGRVL